MLRTNILACLSMVLPLFAFANEAALDAKVTGVIGRFVDALIDPLVIGLFALAFLLFMWGLLTFMVSVSNGEPGDAGKRHMLWGIIGLVIMFSVAGIMNVITNSIGDTGSDPIQIKGGFE